LACTDFTFILSKLLADTDALEFFTRDRHRFLQQYELQHMDYALLANLSAGQLRLQSAQLITKRMREVGRIIPVTLSMLGDEYAGIFRQYASQFWPSHHNRHALDAYQFCRYLVQTGYVYSIDETLRLALLLGIKRFGILLGTRTTTSNKKRWVFRFLLRWRDISHEWRFYFSI